MQFCLIILLLLSRRKRKEMKLMGGRSRTGCFIRLKLSVSLENCSNRDAEPKVVTAAAAAGPGVGWISSPWEDVRRI